MRQFIEFAESVKALAATTETITPEQINALSVLDPEFKENAEKLYNVFSTLFTPAATTSVTSTTPIAVVEKVTEEVATETENIATAEEDTADNISGSIVVPPGYHKHPSLHNVCANEEGDILVNGVRPVTKTSAGIVFVKIGNQIFRAARIVYESVSGRNLSTSKERIFFKNDNSLDLRFSNLQPGGRRAGGRGLDEYVVHEVCAYIAEHPKTMITHMPEEIFSERKVRISVTGIRAILDGKYSKISEKYFHKGPGKRIIPVKTEAKPVEEVKTDVKTTDTAVQKAPVDPCQAVLDKGLQEGIRAFNAKFLSGEKITNGDLIVPIVRFMYNDDGSMATTATIKECIRTEYGSEVIPTDKLIMDVKEKRLGKAVIEAALKK